MSIIAPVIYGDVTWYTAQVTAKTPLPDGDLITVQMQGKNQLDEISMRAEADILLPAAPPSSPAVPIITSSKTISPIHQIICSRAEETPQQLAIIHYRPKPYYGRVVYFRALSRPLLSPRSPIPGWRTITTGEFIEIPIPGSHEGIFRPPNVSQLSAHLLDQLQQAIQIS